MTEIKLPSGRTVVGYDLCSSRAIADGSYAQMAYFVEDAKKDIAYLAALSTLPIATKITVHSNTFSGNNPDGSPIFHYEDDSAGIKQLKEFRLVGFDCFGEGAQPSALISSPGKAADRAVLDQVALMHRVYLEGTPHELNDEVANLMAMLRDTPSSPGKDGSEIIEDAAYFARKRGEGSGFLEKKLQPLSVYRYEQDLAGKDGGQEVEAVTMKRPADLARTETGQIINGHYIYALEVAISTQNLKIGQLRAQPAIKALVEAPPSPQSTVDAEAVERLTEALRKAETVLDVYADPTGYTDGYGDPVPEDADQHEGLLAKEALEVVRAALSKSPSSDRAASEGWQSIETAPKHQNVLVWREDAGEPWVAQFTDATFYDAENGDPDDEAWFDLAGRYEGVETPTHWRPLPAPPEIAEAKGSGR